MKGMIKTSRLFREIKGIIEKARLKAYREVNRLMLNAYFEIGRKIVEEEYVL